MAAQKGRDLLLKVDGTGTGTYVTVAGLRARKLAFSAEAADVTDSDSAGRWRELLAGSGVRRASLSGSGVFRDAEADATVRALFFGSEQRNWEVVIPDFGVVTGPFHISALEYAGEHDGEVTFEMALESAGELTFSAH